MSAEDRRFAGITLPHSGIVRLGVVYHLLSISFPTPMHHTETLPSHMAAVEMSQQQLPIVFPVVLALTKDTARTAAVRVTQALARDRGAIPTVLHVVENETEMSPEILPSMPHTYEEALNTEYQNGQLLALESDVHTILGDTPSWRFEIATGRAVPCIAQGARNVSAELVVLGLPHHTALQRAMLRDTVQGIVEQATTPVLAVRPALTTLPTHAMVAMDFSPASLRAAHLARRLMHEHGHMELVYVQPEIEGDPPVTEAQRVLREVGLGAAFAALIDDLVPSRTMPIRPVVYQGSPVEQIRTGAERLQPDLIALGSGRHTPVDWFFGDTVSTALMHARRWSLLLVPCVPDAATP